MLFGTPSLVYLIIFGGVYSIYCLSWVIWYICKNQSGVIISEAEEVLFSGGSRYVRNAFFIGVAVSQLFTTSLESEMLYFSGLHTVVVLISRVVAFACCMIFWNHLASLRFRSVEEYLQKRFDSNAIHFLYQFNRVFGMYYIWSTHLNTFENGRLFTVRSSLAFIYLTICFGTMSALGGLNSVLIACVMLWVNNCLGQVVLLQNAVPYVFKNGSIIDLQPDICYSLVGPTCIFAILAQMLTVQPFYNLFQATGSLKEGNIAMLLGMFLYLLNTALAFCSVNGIRYFSALNSHTPIDGIQVLFERVFDSAGHFVLYGSESNATDFTHDKPVSFPHFVVLLGPFTSNSISMFLLQIHAIAMHTYQHLLPNWLRQGLVSDGRELHMTFSSLSLLSAFLTIVLLIYSSVSLFSATTVFEHAFPPNFSGTLLLPVSCFILLSPLCADLWSVPAIVVTVSACLAGLIFTSNSVENLNERCISLWLPTFIFIPSLIATLILAAFLRAPYYLPANMFFKHHIKFHQRNERTRSLSILSTTTGTRSARTSFRLGAP